MSGRRHATRSQKTLSILTLGLGAGLLSACADVGDVDEADLAGDDGANVLAAVGTPTASAAAFRCSGDRIALRTAGGQFISVVNDVLGGLVAHSRTPSESETFLVYAVGPNQVALRANNGWFVTTVGSSLFTTARSINGDSVFTVTPHWNGAAWALQTSSGTFITAERGGGSVVNVSRRSVGDWQAFTAACISTTWTTPPTGSTGPTGTTGTQPPGATGWDQPTPPTGTNPPWGATPPTGTTTTPPPWATGTTPGGTPGATTTPPWPAPPTGTTTTTPPWATGTPAGTWSP